MINVHVYDSSRSAIAQIKRQMQDEIDKQFSAKVRLMFRDLVKISPQWSGDFAANWVIAEDPNFSGYTPVVMKGHTRFAEAGQVGDSRGVTPAINRSNFQSKKLSYKKPVYFINNAPPTFAEGADPVMVSGNSTAYPGANFETITKVRPENLVDGKVVFESYLRAKYQ